MSNSAEDDRSVVTLVDRVLTRAVRENASDVHIEPRPKVVRVRFRIDGLLVERPSIPVDFASSVVSRLKIMARLDIAEKRLPQDGAFRMHMDAREIDIRLSSFPTEYGEKVVLRVLSRDASSLDLGRLGMSPDLVQQLRTAGERSFGMILVTGPTGSGKTSTLYALLRQLDARKRNIITLEDPIEYRFENVIQGQTNPKIGLTFAKGLRAILRQDPDVIMVGEVRDAETAGIAFKSALTGHLVLSSLHTSSAIETFIRLFDMGLERYVVASALSVMMGQRLVRRLCPDCRQRTVMDAAAAQLFGQAPDQLVAAYEPGGCKLCLNTGYRGRQGIFELVDVDDELADLVKSESTTRQDLASYLRGRGLRGLRAAGYDLVATGVTSASEVLRVT